MLCISLQRGLCLCLGRELRLVIVGVRVSFRVSVKGRFRDRVRYKIRVRLYIVWIKVSIG